jgi:hypothetical protein
MMALKKAKRINDQIAEILSIKKESFWSLETKCGLFFSSVKASHSNGKLGMKRNNDTKASPWSCQADDGTLNNREPPDLTTKSFSLCVF